MNATNLPDSTGSRKKTVDKLVELSPRSEPASWWTLVAGLALIGLQVLLNPQGKLEPPILLVTAGLMALTWCLAGWRGWLGTAVMTLGIFIAFLPFGWMDIFLMVVMAAASWYFLRKLEARNDRASERDAIMDKRYADDEKPD